MAKAKVYHTTEEIEAACEQAYVILIGEAESLGLRGGGHFRGASNDRSL